MRTCLSSIVPVAGWLALATCFALAAPSVAAEPRVEMVLGTEPGFPATGLRNWFTLLTELKVDNLQIRGAAATDKIEIVTRGPANATIYVVHGRLTGGNQLIVPGARFGSGDRNGIRNWLEQLKKEGADRAAGAPRESFGLTPQLRALVEGDLSRPVDISTADQPTKAIVERLATRLAYPLLADPAARAALAEADPVADELKGVSIGTTVAALARTAGYAVVPRTGSQGKPEYLLTPLASTKESWPVGWTPAHKDGEIVPGIVEVINVEIEDTPVAEIVEVVTERLKLPVIYDRAIMKRQRLDPTRAKASFPAGKSMYAIVLRRAMFKASLTYEMRLDDSGKPFLWITSVNP
ncbi:MAG: hypothetical protein JSS27_04280 [Planctomycetes bacterium]|nr:hypothetical protein [Planctomycetota bacterium]